LYWLRIGRGLSSATVISVGPLLLDMAEHRATLDGRDLELSPLLMRLLQVLVQHPRRLITRQQLKQQLWPNSERIDTERRLNTAMRALRAALDDDAETPRFIETVRSQGYRWIGPVPAKERRNRVPWAGLAIALCLLAALGAALSLMRREPPPPPQPLATLVRAQTALDQWRAAPSPSSRSAAERAVSTAVKDAPSSPAAQILRAQLSLEAHWDWRTAELAYGEALKLDPSNPDARLGLAWLKVNRGDDQGALADANLLMNDSVVAGERRVELGWLLIRAGRPDLATLACPGSASSLNGLSCAHTALAAIGQLEQARAAGVRLMRMKKADSALIQRIERMPAEAAYKQFLLWRARNFLPPDASYFDRAQVLADAGFSTEALDNLARSVAAHEPLAVKISSSPAFMGLRTNPRYQALVRTVGAGPL
jgi:DNA-binding winged helix-turn-helix (wHTH) protein